MHSEMNEWRCGDLRDDGYWRYGERDGGGWRCGERDGGGWRGDDICGMARPEGEGGGGEDGESGQSARYILTSDHNSACGWPLVAKPVVRLAALKSNTPMTV